MTRATDLNLAVLQAELARLDARLQREVARWAQAGQDPNDPFRGLKISEEEARALAQRPLGANWGQGVAAEATDQTWRAVEARAAQAAAHIRQAAAAAGQTLRLDHLADAFQLDAFALDAFLICLAPTLDLRYERLYGFLQDDVTRRRATVNLILDLLCPPGPERLSHLAAFAEDAPLLGCHLLERAADPSGGATSLLGQALAPDEAVVAWLLGSYQPHPALGAQAQLIGPAAAVDDAVLAGEAWLPLAEHLRADAAPGPAQPVLVLHGPNTTSQQAALRLLATTLQRPLLRVSLGRLVTAGGEKSPLRVLRAALRDARLTGAVPCLAEWDVCLDAEKVGAPLAELLEEVFAYPDLVVLAGQAAWQPRGLARQRNLVWAEFPIPNFEHRLALWNQFVRGGLARSAPQTERGAAEPRLAALGLPDLAGQFTLTAAQIAEAVAAALDRAAQRGTPLERGDLFLAARNYSSPGLATLAHKIEARYTWSDIVLPADQLAMLREVITTVRGRPQVLETWGVGAKLASSAGVSVLFAGPPGTGKTMAAEVIAAELGLELYKIDLSTVVNKYIGETEKNLGRIFDEAARSNAILFFDEADAVFGKRSEVKDAHDRYANIEVSYLLQRMETYDGITVLATNLRANLDEAFTRRLQFAVDFPFPDDAYRARIWQALFPPGVPRAADIDFALLARRFKLAGGNIRNIIISAAYQAAADGGQVTMAHLLHGARRELQKMGRLIKEKEMTYE
ncbi:MAG: ATP-binding protein [Anaerolineales bacterium]|nr:ATP-binding protein [Anaerolineales bacterium]